MKWMFQVFCDFKSLYGYLLKPCQKIIFYISQQNLNIDTAVFGVGYSSVTLMYLSLFLRQGFFL